MCNKIRNAFINGQVCWACPDLYNIVLKSKYPVIIEQLFCIRVVNISSDLLVLVSLSISSNVDDVTLLIFIISPSGINTADISHSHKVYRQINKNI